MAAMQHSVFPKGARVRPRLCLAVAAACGDDNPIAFQHELIVLLVEAWNLPDSDKPEEVLPKSLEGCKRAFQDDLIDVWKFVRPLTETAFPND